MPDDIVERLRHFAGDLQDRGGNMDWEIGMATKGADEISRLRAQLAGYHQQVDKQAENIAELQRHLTIARADEAQMRERAAEVVEESYSKDDPINPVILVVREAAAKKRAALIRALPLSTEEPRR